MRLKYLLALLLFLNLCALKAQKSIVLFFDNDVHCNIDGYKYMAGMRDGISADTAYVGLISSGDYIQGGTIGAISKGEAVMSIIRDMRYDAVALGNHEFDYDAQYTQTLMRKYDAPVVCCNFVDARGRQLFAPYRIKQYGDKKIAFVGVTTPNTLYSKISAFQDVNGNLLYGFCRNNLYEVVQKAVDDARSENVDYVVLLSHVSEERDSIGIDSHEMIARTRGIDVVLDGHSHSVIKPEKLKNADGKEVIIAQTGTQFAYIGKLLFSAEGKISAELIPCYIGDVNLLDESPRIEHAVDSIKSYYANVTTRLVGESDFMLAIRDENDFLQVRCMETNAGDIVSDAIRHAAGADVALVNGGAIRNECPAGKITRGDIIAMCPYDNNIVTLEITGAQIEAVLNSSLQYLPKLHGNFPQVSGISFKVNVVEGGDNFISDMKILNAKGKYKKVKKNRLYKFATTDYFLSSDQFKLLNGEYNNLNNLYVKYSEAVINLIHDQYEEKVPARYQSPDKRINF